MTSKKPTARQKGKPSSLKEKSKKKADTPSKGKSPKAAKTAAKEPPHGGHAGLAFSLHPALPKTAAKHTSFTAVTNAFGRSAVSVTGIVSSGGGQVSTLDFDTTNFSFDELFDGFSTDVASLLIFDDVKISMVTEEDDTPDINTVMFSGALQMNNTFFKPLYDLLKLQSNPVFTAAIDVEGKDLSAKLKPVAFTLSAAGQFYAPITDAVTLSGVALKISIAKDKATWKVSPEAAATLTLNNLGSAPVVMSTTIGYKEGQLKMTAGIDSVKDAFGVKGLNLANVGVALDAGAEKSLALTAGYSFETQSLAFEGLLTPTFAAVTARAENFTLSDLNNLFYYVTGARLSMPAYDVTFTEVSIALATADCTLHDTPLKKGLSVLCRVNVQGHECEARAFISPDGFSFEGAMSNFSIGPVAIKQAVLRLELHSTASGLPSGFAILGAAVVNGVNLNCKVAYEKAGTEWTAVVYAGLDAKAARLSTFFPEAKGSFADTLSFSKAAVIYATADSITQDPDFAFPVKKGLQLTGTLEEIPALSSLTKNKQIGLQLTALIGTTTSITIAMPDTRLSLGKSVTCDPFAITVQLLPKPELDLIFGINVIVPNQDTPLHFDLKLGIGIEGANGSGTMKGYWKEPFGITGLQIGPELALQLDIIYAQFLSTGTPSGFGFVGGLKLGDITGKMALSISEDPTHEILYGEVEELSPQNLVKFVSGLTKLQVPDKAVPDFFLLKQLKLYAAPLGGTIGTVVFEKGFSFACNLILFGKQIAVYASLNENGMIAKGKLDNLSIGPLTIRGEHGDDAQFDFELTTDKQMIFIDAAIDFLGAHAGIYTEISKEKIAFDFDLKFDSLLKFTVNGMSSGSLSQPASMDFALTAEFDNNITAYLKTTVAQKISTASQAAGQKIGDLQKDLTAKEKAYKALYDPAFKKLTDAETAANAYLQQSKDKLEAAKRDADKQIREAQNKLDAAKVAYDNAFNKANNDVKNAEAAYNNAVRNAQTQLDNAKASAAASINDAQNKVNAAKAAYDQQIGAALNKLRSAQNDVNSLQRQIDDENRKWNRYSDWEKFKNAIPHGATIGGLETAKGVATGVLKAAQAVVDAFGKSSTAIAFNTANGVLEAAKKSAQASIDAANKTMTAVTYGTEYVAFNAAKATLSGIQQSAQYTAWKAAEGALDLARKSAKLSIDVAESTVQNVGTSTVWVAMEAARVSLEGIKTGTAAFAYEQAKAYLEGAKVGTEGILALATAIAQHSGDFIDVKHVDLAGSLKAIKNGKLFTAHVLIAVFGKDYNWTLDLDVQNTGAFIQRLFDTTFAEAKSLAMKK